MGKNKIIILDHNPGGRLANELWNFISVYAYALEKKVVCDNYSFFNYHKYFNIQKPSGIGRIFYTSLIPLQLRKRLHRRLVRYMKVNQADLVLDSRNESVIYLPPTTETDPLLAAGKTHTVGWLFRNPKGIEKYRKEIKKYFGPQEPIMKKAENIIKPLRQKFKEVVGVHWRQTDYTLVGTGELYFNKAEVNKILEDYIKTTGKNTEDIVFVICSDGEVQKSDFPALNIEIARGNVAEDLFTLSMTDRIIGSNSTYGAWAAYYGNIPIICFKREPMMWAEFSAKNKFEYYNDATNVQQ